MGPITGLKGLGGYYGAATPDFFYLFCSCLRSLKYLMLSSERSAWLKGTEEPYGFWIQDYGSTVFNFLTP